MTNYIIRGFTKELVYSINIKDTDMERAFKRGKYKINKMNPIIPVKMWCIDREQ